MCTLMTINTKEGTVVTGRTDEFTALYKTVVNFRPRGSKFPSAWMGGENTEYESKHSLVHLTAPGVISEEFVAIDGMNEKGLSTSILYFHYHEYKELELEEIKPENVNFVFLSTYILANYATVQEVREAKEHLEEIFYWLKGVPQAALGQHIAIIDASGDSVVIEPENKEIRVKENPLRVLTNSSPLEYHYENLRKFSHITPYEVEPNEELYKGLPNHKLLTQGNGLYGMPGDFTADSRFVRSAILSSVVEQPESDEEAVNYMFRMLHTSDVVPGYVREKMSAEKLAQTKQVFAETLELRGKENTITDHTDNIIVKDLKNLKFYYKTHDNITPRVVDLAKIKDNTEHIKIETNNDGVGKFTEVELS